ncbi:extracellular solute-binding protein [Kitasatospora sp. NBC_00240]|uniref:ABC transporter substrate-binding protein n=1 Tax=Kitasatospora sp. NBC_00240 TaxID=2903567 RepID=UPI002254AF5B|nr:extracellular solute-binding protein [Kitasatospora sp. NBC_00240]MCX5208330.1 extracellular solute-binding protein [Kitasatospora sp. NBC_00240]
MRTPSAPRRMLAALAALSAFACVASCGSTVPQGGQPATITFWGWAPGYQEAVAQFNATHPGVHVEFQKIAPGSRGGYAAVLTAVKDGTAPCLVQMGYESLPSFAAEGALLPIGQKVLAERVNYSETAWKQSSVAGEVYGFPLDLGPMALYYRRDVYARYGLKPEATWQEFAADAARLRQAAPGHHLTAFTPDDPWWFAALTAQAGGSWFDVKGSTWKVNTTSPNSTKVTAFWQDLLDKDLAKTEKAYSDELFADLRNGTVAALPAPVWFSGLLTQNAASAAGQWAVAPMPRWDADDASGFDGGSATAIIKGCNAAGPALEFANWLGSDRRSLEILVDKAGIYPAAVTADTLPALNRPDPYFGNQVIFDVFRKAQGSTNWTWGPVMNETSAALSAELTKAATDRTPLRTALQAARERTIDAMRGKGIDVTAD